MMPKVEGITVLVQVFDMPEAVAFYRDVLGFEVHSTSEPRTGDQFDWGWLKHPDGAELMLNTAYESDRRPEREDPTRIAAHADTSLFFGCNDLDALYAHLTAHGVEADEPKTVAYGMRQLWLKDRDGYVLCFQHPA